MAVIVTRLAAVMAARGIEATRVPDDKADRVEADERPVDDRPEKLTTEGSLNSHSYHSTYPRVRRRSPAISSLPPLRRAAARRAHSAPPGRGHHCTAQSAQTIACSCPPAHSPTAPARRSAAPAAAWRCRSRADSAARPPARGPGAAPPAPPGPGLRRDPPLKASPPTAARLGATGPQPVDSRAVGPPRGV